MARSTGPILAIGAVTVLNQTVLHDRPIDWRVPIATGVAAAAFAFVEQGVGSAAVAIAYAALFTSLFLPVPGDIDPPVTALNKIMRTPG